MHLLRPSCRWTVTLVSKLWRRLFYEQREPWRCLELSFAEVPPYKVVEPTAAERAGDEEESSRFVWEIDEGQRQLALDEYTHKLKLVQRVAPRVEEASIGGEMLDVLGYLIGEREGLAAFLTALRAATALTSLKLEQPSVTAAAGAALAALSGLRALRRIYGFDEHDAAALRALRRLQMLEVEHWSLERFPSIVPELSTQLTSL